MSKRKKYIMTVLATVTVCALCACGGNVSSKNESDIEETPVVENNETQCLPPIAQYDDGTLEFKDAAVTIDDGKYVLTVRGTYTNDGTEGQYVFSNFGVIVYQDGIEQNDISDINDDTANLIRNVKDGASVDVTYKFELTNDDPVEVFAHEPTAEAKVIAQCDTSNLVFD